MNNTEHFGKLTERMQAFREEVLDAKPYIDAQRAVLATEAYKENQNQPRVMVRALMLQKILEGMSIYIDDKSLIAGNQATKNKNAPIFPEYTMEFVMNELDLFEKRDGDVFYITEETKDQLREIAPFWENNNLRARGEALLPEEVDVFMETGVFGMEGKLNAGDAHLAVNYERILAEGLKGYEERTKKLKAALDFTKPESIDKNVFYKAVLIVIDAVHTFANRYSKLAQDMALTETDAKRKEELLEIKQKYGDERKTKIVAAEGEINIEDLVKEEQTVITLTHFGYVKRMPIDTYKSQKRGGKGITGLATREEDFVKQIFTASTHDTLLFFSNKGKLYRLRGYEIPEAGRTAKGTAIVNLLRLDPGEKISAVIPISNFADGKYLLMGTKQGFIKKTPLNEFDSSRKTGLLSITLREDDELIDVRLTDGQDNVVLVTSQGACITFSEKDVRPMGRTAQGVIGIRLDSEDCVIGMESIVEGNKNATLLAITENGFGKRTELDEYRVQTRGGKGVTTYKITPKTGSLIGIRIATDNEDVMLITDNGTIIRLKVKDISILGRSTQGVTLMRTNEGKVVSIETINPDENEGDE